MEPVKFEESNVILGAPKGMAGKVDPLHVFADGEQCISCWRPSLRERLSILIFGRIWLAVLMGSTQPPVSLTGSKGYFVAEYEGEALHPDGRLGWYLRQLFPLSYQTTYTVNDAGGDYQERCTWRMWFGRCFSVQRTAVQ